MSLRPLIYKPVVLILLVFSTGFSFGQNNSEKIKGLTMVAPPSPWVDSPAKGLENLNTEWVALIPYGYTRKGEASVRYNLNWQWWGERVEGIKASIEMAHNNGIKVLLKPQVYIHQGWVGSMDFEEEEDWKTWEDSYRTYILTFAKIAEEYRVNLFCIGTEYKVAVSKREAFWKSLIKDIRSVYSGKLVYSSNWDSYADFPLWEDLDYIGVSAYFPLVDDKTPTISKLEKAWKPTVKALSKFAKSYEKEILFTEYGYMSVDGCAHRAWEIEKNLNQRSVNQLAQANAYEALLKTFIVEDWWAGGFLWKYFPNMQGHEGYPEKDYTPQGKLAANVIRKYFAK